jgi:hypothetical protein
MGVIYIAEEKFNGALHGKKIPKAIQYFIP